MSKNGEVLDPPTKIYARLTLEDYGEGEKENWLSTQRCLPM